MKPNSSVLQVLVLIALAGLVLLAVIRWKRFRYRRTSRFAALLLIQLLAITTVALTINRSGDFVTTWPAVVGSESGVDPQVVLDHPGRVLIPPGHNTWSPSPAERASDEALARRSRLETVTITGGPTGYSMPATVYLPGSYSATGSRRFPVLQLLAGYPGSYRSWTAYLNLQNNLDALIAAGTMPAVVAVMPYQNPVKAHDSECVDADPAMLAGSLADRYLSTDVPRYVRSHFRVGLTRHDLVVGGYSTGGYCAANLALRHSGTYGGAIVLSGYFRTIVDDTTGPLFADRMEADENAPLVTVRRPHLPLAIFLSAARDNKDDMREIASIQSRFPASDRLRVLITATGGHSSVAWKVSSRLGFAWMATVFGSHRPGEQEQRTR